MTGSEPGTERGNAVDGDYQRVLRKKDIWCSECDDFEFTKTYKGVPNTPGEDEYEESGGFDECPVCGGELKTHTVSKDTGVEHDG